MKLSIAWIFDHIDADWKKIDIAGLVHKFNQTTAEIEEWYDLFVDVELLSFGQITEIKDNYAIVQSFEWAQEFSLSLRKGIVKDQFYLIKKTGDGATWATGQDFYSKDNQLPAFDINVTMQKGQWKKDFETEDYILVIDNKSITHRPDLWGHRGFAREIAAILDLPLKPIDNFLFRKPVKYNEYQANPTHTNPFSITIQAHDVVKRFAGIYFEQIEWRPSHLSIAHRLIRIDGKPIDALVDMTNYVMFDIGQPMHAFDASKIEQKKLIVRMAKEKEPITLLDGEHVQLTPYDIVVADEDKSLGLAGVMGGADASINNETSSLLLESACFDATTIRRTAARYKKRSEASARFEKSLDPAQAALAIERFLYLLDQSGIAYSSSEEIFDLGQTIVPTKIVITHQFIETRLGKAIDQKTIIKILEKLEFKVDVILNEYIVYVPSFRASKDIKIKEDILEEIGRMYGYMNVLSELPLMKLHAVDFSWVYRSRSIKETMAYALQMKELYNYAFFEEEFLSLLKWQPELTACVQSPVSENWYRLVTTLIPGLLKAIVSNSSEYDTLRFFESARTWHQQGQTNIEERKSLAGIFYNKKHHIDFYWAKSELQKLWNLIKFDITWHKIEQPEFPWYAPYQTAHLKYEDKIIGIAGKIRPHFLNNLCMGDAFLFELDNDFLMHFKKDLKQYTPISKYPSMMRDISILISMKYTVDDIMERIKSIDSKIIKVFLIDYFTKEEWLDQKAMTFRFIIADMQRTLHKEEADEIWEKVSMMLKDLGATIR